MKAVIMAGGEGTRLRPITLTRSKPLVPIAGKACIDYVIERLVSAGVKDIIITTGYKASNLIQHTGGGSRYGDVNITYSIEDSPMGTAGGVKKMERFINDTFIVASGDVVADVDFSSVVDFHRKNQAEATMALTTVDEPTQFGIVGIDPSGRILKFKEKPKPEEVFSNLINAGIYVLEPTVFELLPSNTKYDFSKQLFPDILSRKRRLFATSLSGLWKDIGNPFDLIEANNLMIERKGGDLSTIERSEYVDVSILGSFMAGENVLIGPGSIIASSALYPNVKIGNRVSLDTCLLLDGAEIGNDCRIINSFIGKDSVIGEGSILENCVIGDNQSIEPGCELRDMKKPM